MRKRVQEWRQKRQVKRWKVDEMSNRVAALDRRFDEIVSRFNERTELQNQIDFLNKRLTEVEKRAKADADEWQINVTGGGAGQILGGSRSDWSGAAKGTEPDDA